MCVLTSSSSFGMSKSVCTVQFIGVLVSICLRVCVCVLRSCEHISIDTYWPRLRLLE